MQSRATGFQNPNGRRKTVARRTARLSYVPETAFGLGVYCAGYHVDEAAFKEQRMRNLSRRNALASIGGVLAAPAIGTLLQAAEAASGAEPLIATNTYPWLTFARRAKQEFELHTDKLLSSIAGTGISGYEPIIQRADEFTGLAEKLDRHGLTMKSIYVNSVLHDHAKVGQSIADVLRIAEAARKLGVEIIVTNPSPIRWGGSEDKTDDQLRLQAKSLDRLGQKLRAAGMKLAYHNHDAELRQGGREFHHMLTATDPDNVKFCLDAHWVFRGCGDSELAVFDALDHYQDRIVELHLRQPIDGVWTEAFQVRGDIDYLKLFRAFAGNHNMPHLVLEQSVEEQSTNDLMVAEAHRRGRANLAGRLDG